MCGQMSKMPFDTTCQRASLTYNEKMKNRDYKEFAKGTISHIYNRGNNKEKIFFDEQDYKAFLFRIGLGLGFEPEELLEHKLLSLHYSRIRIDSSKNFFKLYSFCLMPNHFHLLLEQNSDISISSLISKVCTSYAKYINQKYKRVGHLFQDQFKAVLIEDNPQLMWTSAYIHMNPVKDGLVKSPEKYSWSSYQDITEKRNLPIVTKNFSIELFGDIQSFEKETLNYFSKENDVKDAL